MSGTVTDFLNVKLRYGAKGNGWADDTAALQDFFDDVGAKGSAVLGANYRLPVGAWMPYGDYLTTAPLTLPKMRGLMLRAQPGTRITYDGDPDIDGIMQLEGDANTIEGLSFYGTAKVGLRIWWMNTGTWTLSEAIVRDCHFLGSYKDCVAVDIRDQALGLSTGNSEYHSFLNCTFRGYGDIVAATPELGAGIRVFGSQSHNLVYDGCLFDGQDNGATRVGLYCMYGAHAFVSRSKFLNNIVDVALSDFHLGWAVRACKSLGSSTFISVPGNSGATTCGSVIGNHVDHGANLGLGSTYEQIPRSVQVFWAGPTIITGNYFSASNVRPRIVVGGIVANSFSRCTFKANTFVGPADYSRDVEKIAYGSGNTVGYHGGVDMSGNTTVRVSCDGGSNLYYKPSTGGWDNGLQMQDALQVQGLAAEGAEPTFNCLGYVDFADGGGATKSVAFVYTELDDYEIVLSMPRITGGAAPGTVVAAAVAMGSYSMTGFDITLDVAPVGYSVRVAWMIWRQA